MNHIERNLKDLLNRIPDEVRLIAVSKTKSIDEILMAYHGGQKLFGENRVQEMVHKYHKLPKDIEWHMIGHLQTNKVKHIIDFVSMVHSVDSVKLAGMINKEAEKCQRQIPCLLQVHIAEEETKFGFDTRELELFISSKEFDKLRNIRWAGLMAMATFTRDEEQVSREFEGLTVLFNYLKRNYGNKLPDFKECSIGMSDDFHIAIKAGATIIRLGSLIFGKR